MKKFFLYGIMFFLVFIILGCETTPTKEASTKNETILEPSAILKFADVPVPTRFKMLGQESFCFENSGVRVGVLKYQGKANIDQVVNFYKEQMVMYNWLLLNTIEYGQRLLNFERDNETCIITLIPKGTSVIINVSLGPKSQFAPTKKTKQVIK